MSQPIPAFERAQLLQELEALQTLPLESPQVSEFLIPFYKRKHDLLVKHHRAGGGGIENAGSRSELISAAIISLHERAKSALSASPDLTIIATGGFGRGLLNPCSDVDLLFFTKEVSSKIKKSTEQLIHQTLYPLWDLGLKVGYAVRNRTEMLAQGKIDPHAKTSLIESRFLCGNEAAFVELKQHFTQQLISKRRKEFVNDRLGAIRERHQRFGNTVFLQEPQVKESPGGLRDYHNLLWFSFAIQGTTDLHALVKESYLTETSYKNLQQAYEFLHRVRNSLHYDQRRANDILTLRLQGIVAPELEYPERHLLRKIEAFMRDYYYHTRLINERTLSVAEIFQLRAEEEESRGLSGLIHRRPVKREQDGFTLQGDRIDAPTVLFTESPSKLMQLFQVAQQHDLKLSPALRKRIKACWPLIDDSFRSSREIREMFQSMLQKKGEVATCLRRMHRVGFLGRYLPEFGALDCLVQHEFFHRYTADEHTLRCIEQLDALADHGPDFFRNLFREIEDPFAIYLSLILHDSGRAENVREHIDGSAMLTMSVCNRLEIHGNRRRLIMFLVDHHLSFWRYATTRNLEDEEVITEFAQIIKSRARLDALILFTYVDSRGTNDEAWNPWKETLMLQLYWATAAYFDQGKAQFEAERHGEKELLHEQVKSAFNAAEQEFVEEHFNLMPERYFHFRQADAVTRHIRALIDFHKNEKAQSTPNFTFGSYWREHPNRGYTTFTVIGRDCDYFIERICCALAAEGLNILNADIYTRPDGIALDIIRVSTDEGAVLSDRAKMQRVEEKIIKLHAGESYNPSEFLKKKTNYLRRDFSTGIPFPVRAVVRNDLSGQHTALEIQAIDRIGLLHDLFRCISEVGLQTVSARISTEKGAAVDTIYIATREGQRVTDEATIAKLEAAILPLIEQMEA